MIRGGSERRDDTSGLIHWCERRDGTGVIRGWERDGRPERWRYLVSGHDGDSDLAVGERAKDGVVGGHGRVVGGHGRVVGGHGRVVGVIEVSVT